MFGELHTNEVFGCGPGEDWVPHLLLSLTNNSRHFTSSAWPQLQAGATGWLHGPHFEKYIYLSPARYLAMAAFVHDLDLTNFLFYMH